MVQAFFRRVLPRSGNHVHFFIWRRHLRLVAAGLTDLFQSRSRSRDYCFFNVLTIALLLLIADSVVTGRP